MRHGNGVIIVDTYGFADETFLCSSSSISAKNTIDKTSAYSTKQCFYPSFLLELVYAPSKSMFKFFYFRFNYSPNPIS